jgi:hypothetical protein
MIYWLLSKLFPSTVEYQYVAHPRQIFYGVFIMAVGCATFIRDGWEVFGVVTFILGTLLSITILLAINWDKASNYWNTLDEFAKTMIKSNNPDLWMALGFKHVPQEVTITERKEDEQGNFSGFKFHRLPVSPATMQMIADKVLLSGNTDFVESSWNIPNFRKIQKELKKEGLLSQKNKSNVRLGYTFNRKGIDTLYQYASEGIRMELKRKENGRM